MLALTEFIPIGPEQFFFCEWWFWFLVCYAVTQLATQLRQRCIQVVCSNKEAVTKQRRGTRLES